VSFALDHNRIAELEGLIGSDLGPILQSLEESISTAIEDADRALGAGEPASAAYAAHRCRNDALLVGALQLQEALATLEAASRGKELEPACAAMSRVREIWPATRDALTRTASRFS
jgi:HPt (histidine-containing phosphotransfer) domain-containing protein